MNTKILTAVLVLASATAFAQVKTKVEDDGKKVTTTGPNGTMMKTKVADDGKMKAKGKDNDGNSIKSNTKPRASKMMKGDKKMKGDTGPKGVLVGGAMMTPDKDIVDNAVGSNEHTTLVTAVKTAGLVETLKSAGPFTVFAPTNEAFAKLPGDTVEKLLQPEMKDRLSTILTYHVVPGRLMANDLKNGMKLTTVEGEQLTVMREGNNVTLKDVKGGTSRVTIPNVVSSNGITHVVDTVLMPSR